jgi:hypothetical protein
VFPVLGHKGLSSDLSRADPRFLGTVLIGTVLGQSTRAHLHPLEEAVIKGDRRSPNEALCVALPWCELDT